MADILKQAGAFAKAGRRDVAAVFYAAASQQENLPAQSMFLAKSNAALLGQQVAEGTWGVSMMTFLSDPRHQEVCEAIFEASQNGKRVLIAGSAAGMYAVAAARGGASEVCVWESNGLLESVAVTVARDEEIDEIVKIQSEGLASFAAGLSKPFDILVVAERCWGSSVTNQLVEVLEEAAPLMVSSTTPVVIPSRLSVYLQLVQSDLLRDQNHLDVKHFETLTGLDYSPYNEEATRSWLGVHLPLPENFRAISEASKALDIDLLEDLKNSQKRTKEDSQQSAVQAAEKSSNNSSSNNNKNSNSPSKACLQSTAKLMRTELSSRADAVLSWVEVTLPIKRPEEDESSSAETAANTISSSPLPTAVAGADAEAASTSASNHNHNSGGGGSSSADTTAAVTVSWPPSSSTSLGNSWVYCHFPKNLDKQLGEFLEVEVHLSPKGILVCDVGGLETKRRKGDDLGLSAYHTSMLQCDDQRAMAYRAGIRQAIQKLRQDDEGKTVRVLDVGAGTGLLSAFAAQAGASVVAVERTAGVAGLAKTLLGHNGLLSGEVDDPSTVPSGKVFVLNEHSSSLAQRGGARPDLVVSEIFGSDPLSESILPVLTQVCKDLKPVAMLPCRCRLWGSLARAHPSWAGYGEFASNAGVDYGEVVSVYESPTLLVDLRDEFSDVQVLTAPAVLAEFDLSTAVSVEGSHQLEVPLLAAETPLHSLLSLPQRGEQSAASCTATQPQVSQEEKEQKEEEEEEEEEEEQQPDLCLVMWWDADCSLEPSTDDDDSLRISTSPEVKRSNHWSQLARLLRQEDLHDELFDHLRGNFFEGEAAKAMRIRTSWRLDRTQFFVEPVVPH